LRRLVFSSHWPGSSRILFHVIGGFDADHHAAGFGLVQNVRGDDFITTGKPIAVASVTASAADLATTLLGTGMP